MTVLATPDKTVLLPGQRRIAVGCGIANGNAAVIFQVVGQPANAVELGYEDAVTLAHGILSVAIQVKQGKGKLSGPSTHTD